MTQPALEQSTFPGPAGVNFRGPWNSNIFYLKRDTITYLGSAFYCLKPNANVAPVVNDPTGSWDLLVSKGDKGDAGLKGDKGDPGAKGDKGDNGLKGDQGIPGTAAQKGDKGDKGDTGFQGLKGDKGDKGDNGIQGLKGDPGNSGTKGDQGTQGLQGLKGDKGDKGDPGSAINAVAKTGDTMTGDLIIQMSSPIIRFIGVNSSTLIWQTNDNYLRFRDVGTNTDRLAIGIDGSIYTNQLGDVKTYIDTKLPKTGGTLTGELKLQSGSSSLQLYNTGSPANKKAFRFISFNGLGLFQNLYDDGSYKSDSASIEDGAFGIIAGLLGPTYEGVNRPYIYPGNQGDFNIRFGDSSAYHYSSLRKDGGLYIDGGRVPVLDSAGSLTINGVTTLQSTNIYQYTQIFSGMTVGDNTSQYPTAIVLRDSNHSSGSKRAAIQIGSSWVLGQDQFANGNRDFFLFNSITGAVPMYVGTNSIIQFPNPPRITTAQVDQYGVCNVMHSTGADDTGNSNVSTAFQVALDKIAARPFGGTLFIPPGGQYRIDNQLNYTADTPIAIRSGNGRRGARLVQNCPIMFNLEAAGSAANGGSTQDVDIEGFWVTIIRNGGTAFRIHNPESVNISKIKGTPTADYYWDTFYDFYNVRTSRFDKMYIQNINNPYQPIRGSCFTLGCSLGSTDNYYSELTIQGFDYAWYMVTNTRPAIEGQFIANTSIVGCNTGITWANQYDNSQGAYVPPLLNYINSHMHCFRNLIAASNVAQINVSHCTLEIDSSYGHQDPAFAFTKVLGFTIADNYIFHTPNPRSSAPITIANGCNTGFVHDNTGQADGTPYIVQLLPGSSNINVHDNAFYGANLSSVVADGGVGNVTGNNNRKLT